MIGDWRVGLEQDLTVTSNSSSSKLAQMKLEIKTELTGQGATIHCACVLAMADGLSFGCWQAILGSDHKAIINREVSCSIR